MSKSVEVSRRRPRVAVLVESSNAYARGLLHGISSYLRENGPWSLYVYEHGRGAAPPEWLTDWRGDGIIARIESPATAEIVLASGLPAVNLSRPRFAPALPYFETDDEAIARLAAEHLLERQMAHFAFCGLADFEWSELRGRAFARFVREAGAHECHVLEIPRLSMHTRGWERWQAVTARWLARLPRPLGVMAVYDLRGREVLEACRRMGIAVPDEVAVVGVDDDELVCELSDPPLTSVAPDTRRTGYLAAAALDRMMSGAAPPESLLVAPLGVVTRRSTDNVVCDDPLVARAARFIRDHATEGINVADVVRQVPASRRVLEQRFRGALGFTLHDHILRVRLERVKQLLRQSRLSLGEIAARTGFTHVEYLSAVFKKKVGQSPMSYRARPGDVLRPARG